MPPGRGVSNLPPRCRSRLCGALPREIKQIQRLTPAEISVGAAERWFHPANAGPLRPTTRAPINKTTASPAKRLRGLEGGGCHLPRVRGRRWVGHVVLTAWGAGAGTRGGSWDGGRDCTLSPCWPPVRGRQRGSAVGTEQCVPGVSLRCPQNAKDHLGRHSPEPQFWCRPSPRAQVGSPSPRWYLGHQAPINATCPSGVLQPGGAVL